MREASGSGAGWPRIAQLLAVAVVGGLCATSAVMSQPYGAPPGGGDVFSNDDGQSGPGPPRGDGRRSPTRREPECVAQDRMGVPGEIMTPDEARERAPIYCGLCGDHMLICWDTGDGTQSPAATRTPGQVPGRPVGQLRGHTRADAPIYNGPSGRSYPAGGVTVYDPALGPRGGARFGRPSNAHGSARGRVVTPRVTLPASAMGGHGNDPHNHTGAPLYTGRVEARYTYPRWNGRESILCNVVVTIDLEIWDLSDSHIPLTGEAPFTELTGTIRGQTLTVTGLTPSAKWPPFASVPTFKPKEVLLQRYSGPWPKPPPTKGPSDPGCQSVPASRAGPAR